MSDEVNNGLESYLSTQLDRAVTVVGLSRPTATGFSADTMIIEIDFARAEPDSMDEPPRRLVVQAVPKGPALFEDYDLRRTFRVQQALAGTDVPAASMRWLCEDTRWIGTPFYVMDFVPGRVPPDRPPYHVEGWLVDSPIAQRAALWNSGIEAMAKLHRLPMDGFEFLAEGDQTNAARQRIRRWRTFGEELGPDAEVSVLAALEALEQVTPEPGPLSVHWGDAKLGNMMFQGEDVAAILDWELCGLSVGEEDLAHWMAVDWLLSDALGNPALEGLPRPAESIANYESILGRPVVGIEWWFAFAAVRMGLIFQRHAVQTRRRSGSADALRPNVIVPHLGPLLDGSTWKGYCAG
jgi:aminoglycoside phosphotransferase (APT) family kinase protein